MKGRFMELSEKALYRNHYILGPRYVPDFDSWNRTRISDSLFVTSHPDLKIERVSNESKSLLLMGYLLDPNRPAGNDRDILEGLLSEFIDFPDLVRNTAKLGGRWIIVTDDDGAMSLFHDAAGLRQVFYTDNTATGDIWCASNPFLLAELLKLSYDPDAAEFIKSSEFKYMPGGRWWPGMGTPYREIRHLLPNHSLDLGSGRTHRYWPSENLTSISVEAAAAEAAKYLKGLMEAAANRFKLTLLISSGKDSRTVLAASKTIREQLYYLSISSPQGQKDDAAIPAALLAKFGLEHHVAKAKSKPSRKFWNKYKKISPLGNASYAANAEAISPHIATGPVVVTGHVSEIAKGYYFKKVESRDDIGPEDLAGMTCMGHHEYAVNAYTEWRADLGEKRGDDLAKLCGYDFLDVFYWEQRAGNWLPMWLLEYDLVWKETVTPFNCRLLLETMLGVDEKFRSPPQYELYDRIIAHLWPELLDVDYGVKSPVGGVFSRRVKEWTHKFKFSINKLFNR